MTKRKILFAGGGVIILGIMLYQIPVIRASADWRVFRITAYVNGILHPVEAIPTALVDPTEVGQAASPTVPVTQTSTANPTPTEAATPVPLPANISLTPPQYEKEDINNCGPATLTMALRMYGWAGDQFDVSKVIKPQRYDRNVNPEELVYWVRNYAGWLNAEYRVNGNPTLLKQLLAAGFPVMIEETFTFDAPQWPNDDLWAAHYVLLTGYDDSTQLFTIQDAFHGPNLNISYSQLEKDWEPFNHLYLILYLPDQEDQLQGLLGADWDEGINRQNALTATRAATISNPNDKFAWFNYGSNLVYFDKYEEANQAYDTARRLGLPQRMFRYQFGPFLADFNTNRLDDLLKITQDTLDQAYASGTDGIGKYSEEAWLWRGYALFRKGDIEGAAKAWNSALSVHPNYCDAEYAINNYIQETYQLATCVP
jgi:tetratricopeptide (TPR) repeat protein